MFPGLTVYLQYPGPHLRRAWVLWLRVAETPEDVKEIKATRVTRMDFILIISRKKRWPFIRHLKLCFKHARVVSTCQNMYQLVKTCIKSLFLDQKHLYSVFSTPKYLMQSFKILSSLVSRGNFKTPHDLLFKITRILCSLCVTPLQLGERATKYRLFLNWKH